MSRPTGGTPTPSRPQIHSLLARIGRRGLPGVAACAAVLLAAVCSEQQPVSPEATTTLPVPAELIQ